MVIVNEQGERVLDTLIKTNYDGKILVKAGLKTELKKQGDKYGPT